MDWEAPADAWYIWAAVTIISFAVAGVALGLPGGPPPDANEAANSIEGVAGSPYEGSSTYETDAETIAIDGKTIEMENEHGTAHASLTYGVAVPVNDHDRLENIVYGSTFEEEYEDELADGDTHALEVFLSDVEAAYDENSGKEFTADGEIRTKEVSVDSGIDGLDPLYEAAQLDYETTDWGLNTGIRTVDVSYDGIEDTEVEFEISGYYIGIDTPFNEDDSGVFSDGEGDLEEEIRSSNWGRPGEGPVEYTITIDNPIESDPTSCTDSFDRGDYISPCSNTVDRSVDFDDEEEFVDLKSDTGRYHVTLVTV